MTSTRPPRIATWLLRHFGSSPNNDAVIGDLNERYGHGRSSVWYWRQVVVAIVVSIFKEASNHKLRTLRAMVVGWSVVALSRYGFSLTWELLSALASWSTFWRHNWILIATQIIEVGLSGVLAGWLVARLHRQRQKAIVLAYALCFGGAEIMWLLSALLPFRFYPLLSGIWYTVLTTLGVLVGGGVFGSRRDEHSSAGSRARV